MLNLFCELFNSDWLNTAPRRVRAGFCTRSQWPSCLNDVSGQPGSDQVQTVTEKCSRWQTQEHSRKILISAAGHCASSVRQRILKCGRGTAPWFRIPLLARVVSLTDLPECDFLRTGLCYAAWLD